MRRCCAQINLVAVFRSILLLWLDLFGCCAEIYLVAVPRSIWLLCPDLFWLLCPDLFWLLCPDLFWLLCPDLRRCCAPDLATKITTTYSDLQLFCGAGSRSLSSPNHIQNIYFPQGYPKATHTKI